MVELDDGVRVSLTELAREMYETEDHEAATFYDALVKLVPSDEALSEAQIDAILRLDPIEPSQQSDELTASYAGVMKAQIESGLCAITGSILVSLQSDPCWNFDQMGFRCDGSEYVFDHASNEQHATAISERRLTAVRESLDARQFWTLKDKAFPHLLFGRDVEAQIHRFDASLLSLLFKHLAELDAMSAKSVLPGPLRRRPFGPVGSTGAGVSNLMYGSR
jgi:hypothetical protein